MDSNKIYNGDCFEVLREIPDKSIDLIICDPPYGITKNKWDVTVSLEKIWDIFKKVSKPTTPVIIFGYGLFSAKIILSNEREYRYTLCWFKGNRGSNFLNAAKQPLRNHEDIHIFYKKQPTYNIQFSSGKPLHSMGEIKDVKEHLNNCYRDFDVVNNPSRKRVGSTTKYPKSILSFQKPHPALHPTQKPYKLYEYLIKTYSNFGDIVLDPMAGIMTTAKACLNTGRNFICVEQNYQYCQKSIKLIGNHIDIIEHKTKLITGEE